MAKRSELAAAYAATTYRVFLPGGVCDLRVGQASLALADWLRASGLNQAFIVTAHNPAAQALPAAENTDRQAALEGRLRRAGALLLAASNIPDGDWPVETACLVAGLGFEQACTFAREYGQNAVVAAHANGVAEIVWLD